MNFETLACMLGKARKDFFKARLGPCGWASLLQDHLFYAGCVPVQEIA